MSKNFNFEFALVCKNLPLSLVNGLSLTQHDPVDLNKAKEQHENYLNICVWELSLVYNMFL